MHRRSAPRTLADTFDPRRNALNALRLVAASTVILAHAWPLAGWGEPPGIGGLTIGDWAVAVFFAISGFLITRSRCRTTLRDFVLRRFLRIYPAYLVVTVVIAFGFAPFAVLALGEPSWDPWSSASFVMKNAFLKVLQDDIAGTLVDVPFPDVWNGSYWTLAYEFACYVLIGSIVSVWRSRSFLVAAATLGMLLAGAGAFFVDAGTIALPAVLAVGLRPAAFFFGGALVFLLAERLPVAAWSIGVVGVLLAASSWTGLVPLIAPLPLAVVSVLVGSWLRSDPVTKRHDLSYGVYLYGWPVGQVIAHFLVAPASPWLVAGVTIATSIPFAALSWLCVERPAIRLGTVRRRTPLESPRTDGGAGTSTAPGPEEQHGSERRPLDRTAQDVDAGQDVARGRHRAPASEPPHASGRGEPERHPDQSGPSRDHGGHPTARAQPASTVRSRP